MDKKNVMLLTVIAVATLLVAVVGATFAYFSLTVKNEGGSTTATTTTESLGTITLSDGGEDLHLTLTAAHMAQAKAGATYWAIKDAAGTPSETAVDAKVVSAKVVGGVDTATYTCDGVLTVAVSGTGINAAELSGNVIFKGDSKTTFTGAAEDKSKSVALKDAATGSGVEVEYKMTSINNTTETTPEEITASMSFVNIDDEQDSLAGKTLTTTITSKSFTCTVDQPAA